MGLMAHEDGRPFGMPRRAFELLHRKKDLEEWIERIGGDDAVLDLIVGNVSNGVPLRKLANSEGLDYGLLWTWMCEDKERITRYENAQMAIAEWMLAETPEIADNMEGDVGRDKLRIDTRIKIATKWYRTKYGEVGQTQINVGANSLVSILQGLPSAQVEAQRLELLEEKIIEDELQKIPEKNPEKT